MRAPLACLLALLLWATPANAQFEAGVTAFERGDYRAALSTWVPLAQAGDARAQNNLGNMHQTGLGTSVNPAEATRWYRRDRKSTRLNSSHVSESRMPSSA